MRKALGLAAASLLLAVAPAAARTVTLTVTKSGFVPKTLAITTADSVSFANQDTVAHQLVLKPSTGFTCSAGGLLIQPGQASTCAFHTETKYALSDAAQRKGAFKGTITVTAAAGSAVTLRRTVPTVTYGAKETFSGTIAAGLANQRVDLLAKECGSSSFRLVASATTTAGGAYSLTAQPLMTTAYQARYKSSSSAESSVRVRPAVRLSRVAPRRFSVRVRAAQSFVGKVLVVQRYSPARRAWLRVRLVSLGRVVPSTASTVVSAAGFRARVRRGLRMRVMLTRVQAAPCYTASTSNVVRS